MTDNDITLREAQQLVDEWIHTYGVRYFSELTNMAVLTEEVGEVARIMARKYGDLFDRDGQYAATRQRFDVPFPEELRRNIEKKTRRDKDRHRNNPKL